MVQLRGGGRGGFGLPPPSKFRSGHLPATAIPISRPIPGDRSLSASDIEISTDDSEDDGYGAAGTYSVESSPPSQRRPAAGRREDTRYSSEYYTQSDVGSSVETLGGIGRYVNGVSSARAAANGRFPVGFTEEDSDDSAASSEFSTTHVGGSINGGAAKRSHRFSEGYASSVPSTIHVESASAVDKVRISSRMSFFLSWSNFLVLNCYDLFRIYIRESRRTGSSLTRMTFRVRRRSAVWLRK